MTWNTEEDVLSLDIPIPQIEINYGCAQCTVSNKSCSRQQQEALLRYGQLFSFYGVGVGRAEVEFKTRCTEGYYGFWGSLLRRSSCCSPIISDEQQTIYMPVLLLLL